MFSYVILGSFTVLLKFCLCAPHSAEIDLILNLMSYYDPNARPVANSSDAVPVHVGIGLQQIVNLDEPTQILNLNVYSRTIWHDVGLSWDPAEYNNITSIRIDARRIWRPDITLYNDVGTQRKQVEKLFPAIVFSDGTVRYFYPDIFSSSCSLNMRYFPWDSQICELEIGSWTYDSSAIKLQKYREGGDISLFMENSEWTLDGLPSVLMRKSFDCCEHPYETILFSLMITRKPMFYLINIVLPSIFVSFVGLLTFFLPPNSGEKVSLSVTVLLASTVFLLIVAELLPPQSETVPLVSEYFECVICLLALSTIVTVFIINMHHREDVYPAPSRALRFIFLDMLGYMMCMKKLRKVHDIDKEAVHDIMKNKKEEDLPNLNLQHASRMSTLNTVVTKEHKAYDDKCSLSSNGINDQSLGGKNFTECQGTKEWILIAMVMDRLFFILFFVVTIITSLTILLART